MKSTAGIFVLALAWIGYSQPARSAITYVDATPSNTTLQGGVQLVAGASYTTGPGPGVTDNLWHLKTEVGNGGNGVWTADEADAGAENVVPLVTTVTFASAGGYQVFAYIWTSDDAGHDWEARVRLGDTGGFSKVAGSEAEPANPARFGGAIITSESARHLVQIPLGLVIVAAGGKAQVYIDDSASTGIHQTWYDGVGYEKAFGALGNQIVAVDCNKTNVPAAPSQSMFRVIGGSSTQSQNATVISKRIGPYEIQFSKSSTSRFEFRGPNGDSSRTIPGGPTSMAFLVADFIGSRDGLIRIAVSNLAAGTYLFRSYHLESFTTGNLGFAQGISPTTQNTLRAQIDGALKAVVQPTALGASGLGTNFISDADIPTLAFPFTANASGTVTIDLSTLYINGADRFIFLNGFEIFTTTP